MEIRDWIRAIGSRLALIAAVAAIAALLAAVIALFQPQQYRATATVPLPDVPTLGPLTSAVGQRVANLEAAVTSDGVLDAVAEHTGAPRSTLDAVTTARAGAGNIVEIRFVGTNRDVARGVVVEAAQEGLLLQAETDAAFARAEADVAFNAYENASNAFDEEATLTGHPAPDLEFNALTRRYLQADTRGAETETLLALAEEIAEVQEIQRLRDAADAAFTGWSSAQERLRQAEGRVAAAEDAQVRVGDVVPLSKLASVVKQAAYAALFGAALAVGFVIIVELLRSGTAASRPSLPRPTRQRTRAGAF